METGKETKRRRNNKTTITVSLDTYIMLEKLKEKLAKWLGYTEDCITWDEFMRHMAIAMKLFVFKEK